MNANEGSRRRNLPLRPRRRRWLGRWRGRVGAALVLASAALPGSVPVAAAPTSDAQATHAYLPAQYKLLTALLHEATAARGAESTAAAEITKECPGVLSGMPQEPSLKLFPALPPRVRGEHARLSEQTERSRPSSLRRYPDPATSLYRPAEETYATEVRPLSWSNPAITSVPGRDHGHLEAVSTPAPSFCADARAWAQSGYRTLSAASREFEASQAARKRSDLEEGRSLETLLKPYENASDRALIRKTNAVENKFLATSDFQAFSRLSRIVGFPHVGAEEPEQIPVGHGGTAAGTRFEASPALGHPGRRELLPSVGDGGIHPAGRSRSADRGRPQHPSASPRPATGTPRCSAKRASRRSRPRCRRPCARSGWCSPTDARSNRVWSGTPKRRRPCGHLRPGDPGQLQPRRVPRRAEYRRGSRARVAPAAIPLCQATRAVGNGIADEHGARHRTHSRRGTLHDQCLRRNQWGAFPQRQHRCQPATQ